MKKIILAIFLLLALTSCFGDSKEVIDAKKDLGVIEKTVENLEEEKKENNLFDLSNDPRISITQISWEPILELDNLKYEDFKKWHAKITGKTLWFVENIKVDFSNENSDYPNDSFVLRKFKEWDKTFYYNANSQFKVLDFGLNKYIFTANSWNWISVLELNVLVSLNDDEYLEWKDDTNNKFEKIEETKISKIIWEEEDIVFTELPEWGDFWNVVKLWEKSFTYSDIKWFEVKKEIFQNISCWKNEDTDKSFVTEFLSNKMNSYFYWNTCRTLIKDKWISFYVIRLDWNNYYYEKHYIDSVHWFYGIYELEKWEWVDSETIWEKNNELKGKNIEFWNTKIVDNLFKKIITN